MGLVNLAQYVSRGQVHDRSWEKMFEEYKEKLSIRVQSPGQMAADLSGGNQQKVVLSKWLDCKPKVMILDEPTRGIDVGAKAEIYAIIDELAIQGVSVIIISSELPEIINMCDRCYVMCEGRITGEVQSGEFSQERIMTFMTTTKSNGGENNV